MPVARDTRQAADEEARAELDLLNSRLEKTTALNKKIQASLARLEATGKGLQEAVGPIYSNTQKLQVLGKSKFCLLGFGVEGWIGADVDGRYRWGSCGN